MNDLSGSKTGCVHMVGSAMMTDVTLLMVSRASCHFAFCYLSHLISLQCFLPCVCIPEFGDDFDTVNMVKQGNLVCNFLATLPIK